MCWWCVQYKKPDLVLGKDGSPVVLSLYPGEASSTPVTMQVLQCLLMLMDGKHLAVQLGKLRRLCNNGSTKQQLATVKLPTQAQVEQLQEDNVRAQVSVGHMARVSLELLLRGSYLQFNAEFQAVRTADTFITQLPPTSTIKPSQLQARARETYCQQADVLEAAAARYCGSSGGATASSSSATCSIDMQIAKIRRDSFAAVPDMDSSSNKGSSRWWQNFPPLAVTDADFGRALYIIAFWLRNRPLQHVGKNLLVLDLGVQSILLAGVEETNSVGHVDPAGAMTFAFKLHLGDLCLQQVCGTCMTACGIPAQHIQSRMTSCCYS